MGTLGLEIEKGLYLGIDFGTTNSVVSIYNYDNQEVITIPIDGNKLFPSVIQFNEGEEEGDKLEIYYGIQAREAAIIYPDSTISSVKRMLDSEEGLSIKIGKRVYSFSPEDIVAKLLAYLKDKADEYLREELLTFGEFSGCVITVPANSTDKQKTRTKNAAIKAGFHAEDIHLRLEPAAAAIHYALNEKENKKLLIYDFGGGTFDACMLDISHEGEEPEVSILSTYGNNRLGGNDIDHLVMDIIYDEFMKKTEGKIDLFSLDNMSKKMAIMRLKEIAVLTKERLSTTNVAKVVLAPFIQEPEIVNINMEITRETFLNHKRKHQLLDSVDNFDLFKDKSLKDIIGETMTTVEKCLKVAGLKVNDVDEIFLVGGSSSIPEVGKQVFEKFGKEAFLSKISPAFSISNGAAHYCNLIMSNSNQGIKMNEKTIHPLGLEISGRRFMEIVKPGLEIPEEGLVIEAEELLETNHDFVTSMPIVVYEDTMPEENQLKFVYEEGMKRLGGTTLRGIPGREKGQEKVKVVFKISPDNLLTVEAKSSNVEGLDTSLSVDELY